MKNTNEEDTIEGYDTLDTTAYRVPSPGMWDDYEDSGGVNFGPPPPARDPADWAIVYEVKAPGLDGFSFKADKTGFLMAVVKGLRLTVSGYELKPQYLSSKQFSKKNKEGAIVGYRKASAFGNYLRAFGILDAPVTPDDYEQLAKATAGLVCQATIEWEAYDNQAKETLVKGWVHFPPDPAIPGARLPYVEVGGRRVWARASIAQFIPHVPRRS